MLTRKRRWTSLSSRMMSPRPPGGASSSRPSQESASCLRLALPMPCTMVRIAAMQGIPMWCALYWLHECIDNMRGGIAQQSNMVSSAAMQGTVPQDAPVVFV